ncbi:extracellular matrix protein 2 [Trichomycterus rosablanca]|uniref:extracellular matrix protein 2 n=1 Tax=Trichomycterus rosablanca TaxID=2290929 RepID=UPI002F35760F
MSWRVAYLCVCVWVCVGVTHSLRGNRREDKQKSRDVAAELTAPIRPVPGAQCLVNGIFLFEGAVWSPDECNVCECRNGAAQCKGTRCVDTALPDVRPAAPEQKPVSGVKLNRKSGQKNVKPAKPNPANSPAAQKKQLPPPARKKQQEPVKPELWDRNVPVVPRPEILPRLTFHYDEHDDDDYVDDDSDPEDDDDNDGFILNSSRTGSVSFNRPTLLPPTQKPSKPPRRKPSGKVGGRGGKVGVAGRPVIRPSTHMDSLPAGCLLSESLIACGSTGLTSLPQIKDSGVRTLYLSDNKISKVSRKALHGLPNLEWLDLSKNKLDDVSLGPGVFRNLTKLRRLNLDGNNLTKIPPLPPSLLELKINDNRLSGITPHSFKGLSHLLTLELEDNHFHDGNVSPLAFRPLKKLIYLRLDDNEFRAVPSGLPPSLKELHLSDNRIEVVHAAALNKTVNLRVLNLSQNKIREDRIPPKAWIHLRKLEMLDLSHNKLVHVPSFLPVGLLQLTLHHNQIERIPGYVFGHMQPGLVSIHLSYNRLREDGISEVSFVGLHRSLNELLLDHNQLRAVPRGIVQLRGLHVLRLNHNYISSVPVNSLCDLTARDDSSLISVHLQNNLIDRRLVPPTALTCIREYSSVILQPQRYQHTYD